jgi:hypothetical protein
LLNENICINVKCGKIHKYSNVQGGKWGPHFFLIGTLQELGVRSPCKILLVVRKIKKKINLPKLVAYLSLHCWSHALRSDQKIAFVSVIEESINNKAFLTDNHLFYY